MSLFLETRRGGQVIGSATGFLVESSSGPVLVTNRHVVTGRDQNDPNRLLSGTGLVPDEVAILHERAESPGANTTEWIPRYEDLKDDRGLPRWREHPLLGARADIVALPLTQIDEHIRVRPYRILSNGVDIAYGPTDRVSVVGFPFGESAGGYLGIWSTGFIASEPAVDQFGLPVFLIDCRTRPGQSGSPVIAYRSAGWIDVETQAGRTQRLTHEPVWWLLGVYSGRINEESDLGWVWRTSAIAELVHGRVDAHV